MNEVDSALIQVIEHYAESFGAKQHGPENEDCDILMDAFGISPERKRENRQYWGRELGMCWQRLVTALFQCTVPGYADPPRDGLDELADLRADNDVIDTKYRIGSGDSGTLKKFREYGRTLRSEGYNPIMLIVREDNLPAAISACQSGGWQIYTGAATFNYIESKTGIDLLAWLQNLGSRYAIQ